HTTGPTLGPNSEPNHRSETPASTTTKRSEVLRHVFPRTRGSTVLNHKCTDRVAKPGHRRSTLSTIKHTKSRVAFHKVITSFFNNNNLIPASNHAKIPPAGSGASSTRSRSGSIYDSIQNLDIISPGAFTFSGPSLRSHSGSFSHSTSRLSSLTENDSESRSLRRVQSTSFVDSVSLLDDGILEPFVEYGLAHGMSDILINRNEPFEELGKQIVENLDEDRVSRPESPVFGAVLAPFLIPHLEDSSRRALRLTCQSWRSTLDAVASLKFPPAYNVPNEILQQIYSCLGPKDFNSARHTCGGWMRASLNKNLLVTMLSRGGWWSSAEHDLDQRTLASFVPESEPSEEWFLSRRLARECALSSSWTGNGLDAPDCCSTFVEASQTDFSDLANGYSASTSGHKSGLVFTTSICGQFLLVAKDTLIYIYDLRGGDSLQPLTSVTCPRRVLSMSMDVSSGRNAVAALLEGRMGMVCELRCGRKAGTDSPIELHIESNGHPCRTTTRASVITSRASVYDAGMEVAGLTSVRRRLRHHPENPHHNTFDNTFNSVDVQANYQAISLHGPDSRHGHRHQHSDSDSDSGDNSSIPIESGTSTFYRHLCSEDDPPRSVSICPQRRCVAFGCSAGIELHWIDALTGQSLSRWFPLTAPSDYLYFLSPRPGFESAKKLRLISSAAHPDDWPAICRTFFFGPSTLSSFWSSFGFESSVRRPSSSCCDHYHAVPLSDGHHVLFIDPPTSKLFLGCDAPLGGPTKLLRKILFIPPEPGNQTPRIYTVAADLTWGARVVVVFGDSVILYSVPPDVITLSCQEQNSESWDVYTAPPFTSADCTKDHWLN
ncbi:hypothetical protein K504DRAFT_337587, partial [Pleomassaria siparia CBS 279.74]